MSGEIIVNNKECISREKGIIINNLLFLVAEGGRGAEGPAGGIPKFVI